MCFEGIYNKYEEQKQFHAGGQMIFPKQLIGELYAKRIQLKLLNKFNFFWIQRIELLNDQSFEVTGLKQNNRKIERTDVKQETFKYQLRYMLFEISVENFNRFTYQFEYFDSKYNDCHNIGDFIKTIIKLQKKHDPWIHDPNIQDPYSIIYKQKSLNSNNNDNDNDDDEEGANMYSV